MQFSLLDFWNERSMRQFELHPPHLINVATLPCESRKTKIINDDPGPLMTLLIQLMQFSLVISRCNITFSVFWLSQGSVATLIMWRGWSSYHHVCRSFFDTTVKNCIKIRWFFRKLQTKTRHSIAQCRTGWPPCRVKIPRSARWISFADAHCSSAVQ